MTKSSLWFLISMFLVIWLGYQLFGAAFLLEIENLRTTDIVTYEDRPFWFLFVVFIKSLGWGLSALLVYKYAKSRLLSRNE